MVADLHVAKLGVQRRRRYRRKLDTSMQTVAIRRQVVSATCIELEMDILGNTAETQLRLTKHIPESSPDLVDIDIEAAAGKIIYGGGLVLGNDEYCIANRSTYPQRSEEHTSELQSLMRISYAVFCLKNKNTTQTN